MKDHLERTNRPDLHEYQGHVKGQYVELWWDNQLGVIPGWCVRINAGIRHRERDIPVKGRKYSKVSTLIRNTREVL